MQFVDGKQEDMSLALGQILDKIDSETRDPTVSRVVYMTTILVLAET